VIEWQLEFPQGIKEECAEWLKAEKKAGRVRIANAGGGGKEGKEGKRAKSDREEASKKLKIC
jgi:hypothetical protein